MGHIKEPQGIDFIIKSDPLTDQARQEISKFISDYKRKEALKKKKQNAIAGSKRSKSVPA